MGDKNKHNGQAEDNPRKDEEVGAEGDETTDDEGGVDTPPPQKDEEDTANEDGTFEVEQIVDMECQRRWKCPVKFRVRWAGYSEKDDTWLPASELSCEDLIKDFLEISGRSSEYKTAMAPKKRAADNEEMTMQTRKAACFSYSELDEDQDEVIPAGTRTRKVKVQAPPKAPKVNPKKKRIVPQHVPTKGRPKKEPEEYEVEAVVDHRVRGRFTEYKVRWKGFGPRDDSWVPEAELNCDDLLNKYFKTAGRNVEESYEVQEIMAMREVKGRTEYKVRWKGWSAKYDSWLAEEELNCPQLLKRFRASHPKEEVKEEVKEEEKEEEEQEYEVEKILDERQKRGKKEYLVQWKNLAPKHNTWEPEENLLDCKDALRSFFDSLKKVKSGKAGRKAAADKKVKQVAEPEPESEPEPEPEPEVEEPRARSRRAGKNRSYSEFYNQ